MEILTTLYNRGGENYTPIDYSEIIVQSANYTPDFFDFDINMNDLTIADREYGDGTSALFMYKLSNIKHQWTNEGTGTIMVLKVVHDPRFVLSKEGVYELIMREFAEWYI